MLNIHFISIFPDLIRSALSYSIPNRAMQSGLVQYNMIDPRNFTEDKHQKVDDSPFGGGPGMLMKAEPLAKSIESLLLPECAEIIFTDPTGERFDQHAAWKLSSSSHLVFVCGRYEGIDERVQEQFATRTYSIGDYILSGGEFAALVMADAVVRLIPGALGKPESLHQDSFVEGLLSFPQYTRPKNWRELWDNFCTCCKYDGDCSCLYLLLERQRSPLGTHCYYDRSFSPLFWASLSFPNVARIWSRHFICFSFDYDCRKVDCSSSSVCQNGELK